MRRGSYIVVGCAIPLAALYLIGCYGCSTSSRASSSDGGVDAPGPRLDGGRADETSPPEAGPVYGPEGWIRDDAFDPECGFYVPPSKDKLPPPIAWEACDPSENPPGIGCRQIALNWPPPSDGQFSSAPLDKSAAMTDADGGVTLQVTRFTGPYAYRLVAEADGPVHTTVLETSPRCTLTRSSLKDHKVAFTAAEPAPGGLGSVRWGAMGGDIDELHPRTLRNYQDTGDRDYLAGATDFFENGPNGLNLYSWVSGSLIKALTLGPSDPAQVSEYWYQGDALFFSASNGNYSRIKIFTPAGGTRDFVSFGNVASNAAADFGTDGIDMAWIEASGAGASPGTWTTLTVMTAPFTTDPNAIVKRRLRSEDRGYFGDAQFTVGCGYAAHSVLSAAGNSVRVVRLSDGVSWNLFSKSPWHWTAPLALTCTELFINIVIGSQFDVARVRLSSLGPGIAPD
jgi:hypothetical protein